MSRVRKQGNNQNGSNQGTKNTGKSEQELKTKKAMAELQKQQDQDLNASVNNIKQARNSKLFANNVKSINNQK